MAFQRSHSCVNGVCTHFNGLRNLANQIARARASVRTMSPSDIAVAMGFRTAIKKPKCKKYGNT
jgi:hypothetical protein